MKATELRIGNWLIDKRYTHDSENGRFKVHVRDLQYLTDIKESNECDFEPIPLTEEILLKCGFKKTEEYYAADEENVDVYTIGCFDIAFIDNEYKLWISIDEDSYYNFAWTEIKYLHQLQNIYFALTGQELEVNL